MFDLLNKKVLFILLILGLVGFVGYKYIYLQNLSPKETLITLTRDVKGSSTHIKIGDSPKIPTAIKTPLGTLSVASSLTHLQQEVDKLDTKEIASSSPQIQKIIQELQVLQNASGSPVRSICQQVCSNLQ